MGIKCGTCKYFDGQENYGHCHRYAPKPKLGDASTLSMVIFPYLHAAKWCGEWTHKEREQDNYEAWCLEGNEEGYR